MTDTIDWSRYNRINLRAASLNPPTASSEAASRDDTGALPARNSELSEPITLDDIAAIGAAIVFVLAGPLITAGAFAVYILLNS